MVLGYFPVPDPGRIEGQGPTVLAVGAGGSYLDIFTLVYHLSLFSLSPRYRLKYCLKGPLNPLYPTFEGQGNWSLIQIFFLITRHGTAQYRKKVVKVIAKCLL